MSDIQADFLKLELQLQFLEAAIAGTAFVVSHLVKALSSSPETADQREALQADEHHLRTLLHQVRARAQQEIESDEQVREGQQLYHELLHDFEAATLHFTDRATALAAALPPAEQAAVQVHLVALRDFREDFAALN
jgi:hypothetical protein